MKRKEISNSDLIKAEYDKELKVLREDIAQKVREEQSQNIKGRGIENESMAEWQLNKFPATAREKENMVSDHNKAKAFKEAQIQKEIEVRLKLKQPILEKLHFGAGGLKGAQESEARERQIQTFRERIKKRDALKQKATLQKREIQNTAQKVIKQQKETRAVSQDNQAYRPKGDERIKTDFKTQAEKTKTLSMEMNAQSEKVKNIATYKEELDRQSRAQGKRVKVLKFKKDQEQKGKKVIEKQTETISPTQDNELLKTIDAGADFNRSNGAEETDIKPVKHDQERDNFKARLRARDKEKAIHKHDRGKSHTQ